MHCKNPGCYEDTCNGECARVKRLAQQAKDREANAKNWPWYRYKPEENTGKSLTEPRGVR